MEIHINFDTECVEKINATCNENNTCWDGYNELSPAYILFIPMIIALAVSVFTYWKFDKLSSYIISDSSYSGMYIVQLLSHFWPDFESDMENHSNPWQLRGGGRGEYSQLRGT